MATVIYISRATALGAERAQMQSLVSKAAAHNEKHGITGVLIHANGRFMQVLEGSKEVVIATLQRIQADRRHEQIDILKTELSDERFFSSWSMNLVEFDEPESLTHQRIDSIKALFRKNPNAQCIDAFESFVTPAFATLSSAMT